MAQLQYKLANVGASSVANPNTNPVCIPWLVVVSSHHWYVCRWVGKYMTIHHTYIVHGWIFEWIEAAKEQDRQVRNQRVKQPYGHSTEMHV